jgi:hypothetical protein
MLLGGNCFARAHLVQMSAYHGEEGCVDRQFLFAACKKMFDPVFTKVYKRPCPT